MDTHFGAACDARDVPVSEGHCGWCERALRQFSVPDDRTMALWIRGSCRDCGDKYELTADLPQGEVQFTDIVSCLAR